jgi:hypothetical protein
MELSHELRLAAISAPGARPPMLPQAAEAITAWLDTAPAPLHVRILPAAESLAGAIPAALRLGPEAAWRADWAKAFAGTAALMPAEAAAAFCRRVEQGLFGQSAIRGWTKEELAAQTLLKSKFNP